MNNKPINFRFQQSISYFAFILLLVTPILRFSWDIWPKTFINVLTLASAIFIINAYKLSFNRLHLAAGVIFAAIVCISSIINSSASFLISDALIVVDCVFLACVSSAVSRDDKQTLLIVPVLIGGILSLIVIIRLLLILTKLDTDNTSLADIFVNFNVIAGYLVMVLPLSLILWKYSKLPGLTLTLLIFCGILATGSRSAAVIGVITSVIIVYSRCYKGSKGLITVFSALTLSIAAGSVILSKPRFFDSIIERLNWINTAIAMFAKNPLLGVGWGNFAGYYTAYKTAPGLNSLYTHNILFQLLAETGLLGLISFIFLIFTFVKQADIKNRDEDSNLCLPVLLSVFAFLCFNLFDYSFYIPALTILFFFILGASAGLNLTPQKSSLPVKVFSVLVFIAVSFVFARPLISNILFERGTYYFKNGDYSRAQQYAQRSVLYNGKNWEAYSKLAEIHFASHTRAKDAAELQQAFDCQLKAIKYYPQSAALHSDMAWLYLNAGRRDKALSEIKQAILLDKYNDKFMNTLMLIENNH